LNETQFENKCQILSQEGLPLFGGLTIALTFWQNIFAGLFVHLNGGKGKCKPMSVLLSIRIAKIRLLFCLLFLTDWYV
jgi:hypothetical protein